MLNEPVPQESLMLTHKPLALCIHNEKRGTDENFADEEAILNNLCG
jgi:hypothetical protein